MKRSKSKLGWIFQGKLMLKKTMEKSTLQNFLRFFFQWQPFVCPELTTKNNKISILKNSYSQTWFDIFIRRSFYLRKGQVLCALTPSSNFFQRKWRVLRTKHSQEPSFHLTPSFDLSMTSFCSLEAPFIAATWLFSNSSLHSVWICWELQTDSLVTEFDAHSEFIEEEMDAPMKG